MGISPIPTPSIESVSADLRAPQSDGRLNGHWFDLPIGSLRQQPFVAVVPIKGFADAKSRLTAVLSAADRTILARLLAERTLESLRGIPTLVICDDEEVSDMARQFDAAALHVATPGLNIAVTAARNLLSDLDASTMAVVHSDIMNPSALTSVLGAVAQDNSKTEAVIVPDRHGLGTNILVVPIAGEFVFSYGANSFQTHCDQAVERGLAVQVIEHPQLGWDVDVADDLTMLPDDLRAQLFDPL